MKDSSYLSEEKQQRLRSRGIVAYSTLATSCVVASGIVFSIYLTWDRVPILLNLIWSSFATDALPVEIAVRVFAEVFILLIVPAATAFVLAAATGLFQTRFLFVPSIIGIDFSRVLFSFSKIIPKSADLFYGMVASLLLIPLVLLAAFFFLKFLSVEGWQVIGGDKEDIATSIQDILAKITTFLLPSLVFIGFVSLMVARIRFRISNRMTREEIREEENSK